MIFQSFSKKQLQALSWWYRGSPYASYTAVICDGAVRSGKTLCMSISFFLWAFYQFQNQSFAFCGNHTLFKAEFNHPCFTDFEGVGFSMSHSLFRKLFECNLSRTKKSILFVWR